MTFALFAQVDKSLKGQLPVDLFWHIFSLVNSDITQLECPQLSKQVE